MKIAIDIRGANLYHGTGIGTYTKNLITHLLKIDEKNFYELFCCGKNLKQFKTANSNVNIISRKQNSFYAENFIPRILKKGNFSLFHMPQNGIGFQNFISNKLFRNIVTIHDLIPYSLPQTVGKSYLKNFLKQIPYVVENSSAIITVSNYSKNEILKFFDINPDKIFVTHLAADKIFKPLDINFCKDFLKKNYKINHDFILYIGGFSKRKNLYNLITAFKFAHKNFKTTKNLILIGNIREEFESIKNLIRELNIENKIIFLGFVPEEELPIFYNACSFFVYLSLFEGFGLPLLEAMSCKKAVLCSNLTSIPEITNNSCYSIDPLNTHKISEAMCEMSNNEIFRVNLEDSAYEQSKKFSWEKCSKETLKVYKKVCENIY